jgi:Skp family chaperone for outer membrane proteins
MGPAVYLITLLALLASESSGLAQARSAPPIAYISLQRILTESDDAKAAFKQLEAFRASSAQEVNMKKQTLEATRLQIANAGGIFSASKRLQLTDLAKRQELELQQATQKAQTDFADLQKKFQERLRADLSTVVTALAAERGVQYVLNQDAAVILAPKAGNWTDEVLQRLNKLTNQKTSSSSANSSKGSPESSPAKTP